MHFQESEIGYFYSDAHIYVFFGKAQSSLQILKSNFPEIQFLNVRQTHSDTVVVASPHPQDADAHWTNKKNVGLLISTADCLPILIHNKNSNTVAAVHAGWKGVCNQITYKALTALSTDKSTATDFSIFLGPHIQQQSFEVQNNVLDLLLSSSHETDLSGHFSNKDKILVDLKSIVLSQANACIGKNFNFCELNLDTKTNAKLHSYRRDHTASGRNLSFIFLK